jgi:hypothetical protein
VLFAVGAGEALRGRFVAAGAAGGTDLLAHRLPARIGCSRSPGAAAGGDGAGCADAAVPSGPPASAMLATTRAMKVLRLMSVVSREVAP